MTNKKVTIENLAQMIKKGFDEAQEDREGIKGDITGIKGDVKDIKVKLASLERRIIFLEDKATEHSKILAEHSKELRKIKSLIQKFQKERKVDKEKIVWLEKRINRLEAKVGI